MAYIYIGLNFCSAYRWKNHAALRGRGAVGDDTGATLMVALLSFAIYISFISSFRSQQFLIVNSLSLSLAIQHLYTSTYLYFYIVLSSIKRDSYNIELCIPCFYTVFKRYRFFLAFLSPGRLQCLQSRALLESPSPHWFRYEPCFSIQPGLYRQILGRYRIWSMQKNTAPSLTNEHKSTLPMATE